MGSCRHRIVVSIPACQKVPLREVLEPVRGRPGFDSRVGDFIVFLQPLVQYGTHSSVRWGHPDPPLLVPLQT